MALAGHRVPRLGATAGHRQYVGVVLKQDCGQTSQPEDAHLPNPGLKIAESDHLSHHSSGSQDGLGRLLEAKVRLVGHIVESEHAVAGEHTDCS